MSLLVHIIGFTCCSAVVAVACKSLYHESNTEDEKEFAEDGPEYAHLAANTFGLGVAVAGYGFEIVEEQTEKLFDSRLSTWFKGKMKAAQVDPDGVYFKFKFGEDNWNGYVTDQDKPKIKPSKFEMEI